jgi:hypothetical protein
MKLKCVIFLILTCMVCHAYTQGLRFNPYGVGVFDDRVDSYSSSTDYYNGKVRGGLQWGGGVEFRVKDGFGFEVMYLHQDTKAPLEYYDPATGSVENTNFDVALSYLMVSGLGAFHISKKVEPYLGLMGGLAVVNAEDPESANGSDKGTRFAWGGRAGLNLWMTNVIGIKFQAQIMSVSRAIGGALFFGPGATGAGVSTYSSLMQFGLGGGLTFKLGK